MTDRQLGEGVRRKGRPRRRREGCIVGVVTCWILHNAGVVNQFPTVMTNIFWGHLEQRGTRDFPPSCPFVHFQPCLSVCLFLITALSARLSATAYVFQSSCFLRFGHVMTCSLNMYTNKREHQNTHNTHWRPRQAQRPSAPLHVLFSLSTRGHNQVEKILLQVFTVICSHLCLETIRHWSVEFNRVLICM